MAKGGRQSWDPLVVVAAVRGPEAMNTTEVDIGYRNVVDEHGANFWTPPRTSRDEARQSQLALVGDASNGWQDARADATATLEGLLCSLPAAARAAATTADAAVRCTDDPSYLDVWSCDSWRGFACAGGAPPVDTADRIALLMRSCPEACADVEVAC